MWFVALENLVVQNRLSYGNRPSTRVTVLTIDKESDIKILKDWPDIYLLNGSVQRVNDG